MVHDMTHVSCHVILYLVTLCGVLYLYVVGHCVSHPLYGMLSFMIYTLCGMLLFGVTHTTYVVSHVM
jgi:hypothetical protein